MKSVDLLGNIEKKERNTFRHAHTLFILKYVLIRPMHSGSNNDFFCSMLSLNVFFSNWGRGGGTPTNDYISFFQGKIWHGGL